MERVDGSGGEEDARPPADDARTIAKIHRDLATFVHQFHPETDEEELFARGGVGLGRARASFEPHGGIPFENHAWGTMLLAIVEGMHDQTTQSGRALASAYLLSSEHAMLLEHRPDQRLPLVRLTDIAGRVAMDLFIGFTMHMEKELKV